MIKLNKTNKQKINEIQIQKKQEANDEVNRFSIKKASRRALSFLLSFTIFFSSFVIPIEISAADGDATDPSNTESTYKNDYIVSSGLPTEGIPQAPENTEFVFTADSATIQTVDDFINYSTWSQYNDTTGKTFTVNTSAIFVLGSDFYGFGSETHPFKGTLTTNFESAGDVAVELTGSSALFNCLSSAASVSKITVRAKGAFSGLAQTMIFESASDTTINTFNDIILTGNTENKYLADSGLLFGKAIVKANNTLSFSGSKIVINGTATVEALGGHAGGLIGSVVHDSALTSDALTLTLSDIPTASVKVTSTSGNAGGIIGNIGDSITAALTGAVSVSGEIRANRYMSGGSDLGGNAGGIAGNIDNNAKISIGAALTVQNMAVTGGKYIGGFAGSAKLSSITITDTANVTIGSSTDSVSIGQGIACGGFIGYAAADANAITLSRITVNNTTIIPTNDTQAAHLLSLDNINPVGAGGLIGYIDASVATATDASLTIDSTVSVTASFANSTSGSAGYENIMFGGLAGIYGSGTISRTLAVNSLTVTITPAAVKGYAYGGAIGYIAENSYCELTSITAATVGNINSDRNVRFFGGVLGYIADGAGAYVNGAVSSGGGSVRYIDSVTMTCSGGIAAYTANGSFLRLGGTINTAASVVQTLEAYATYTGHLVGAQGYSLIFTNTGYSHTKDTTSSSNRDDIGNTGDVINLYNAGISGFSVSDDTHTVTITKMPNNTEFSISNVSDFAKLAVTLQTHGYFSGVTGVTSENYDQQNLLGRNITLTGDVDLTDTGINSLTRNDNNSEPYTGTLNGGSNTVTLDIQTVGHQYLGLFASVNGATVTNLTIDGAIYCDSIPFGTDNSGHYQNDRTMYVGGIAGCAFGSLTVNNVSTAVEITEKNRHWYEENVNIPRGGCYGGLIGYYNLEANSLSVINSTTSATINIILTRSGNNTPFSGGMIGFIAANGGTVNFEGCTVSSKIQQSPIVTSITISNAYVGGLVAYMTNTNSSQKTAVNFSGITVTASALIDMPAAVASCGGFLAHTLAATVRTTITTSDLTTDSAYGAEITIDKSTTVAGVLNAGVAPYGGLIFEAIGKLEISDTTVSATMNSTGTYSGAIVGNGTFLYMIVNADSVTIDPTTTTPNTTLHDLLVGRNIGIRTSTSTQRDPIYGGILTIETGDGTGKINNSKFPGTVYNTNTQTRYYYNIKSVDTATRGEATLTNTQSLMLWQIRNYTSPSPNRSPIEYFGTYGAYYRNFTATANDAIDLSGTAFYPLENGLGTLDFNSNTVTFGYDSAYANIGQLQYSQTGFFHYMTSGITLSNASLAGTIGKYGEGSGVLISGTSTGSHINNIHTLNITNVTLVGITVDGTSSPLLVNALDSFVTVNVTGVFADKDDYPQDTVAASALFGVVGSDSSESASSYTATSLKLTYSNIRLDGDLFGDAILMTHFRVANDNASNVTYNFGENETNVTYGQQLGNNVTEYYDSENKVNNGSTYDFTGFKPYIITIVPAEYLRINKKSQGLTEGCGTQEDPYRISTVSQLMTVYAILNGDTISTRVNYPNNWGTCTDGTTHTEQDYNGTDAEKNWIAGAYYVIAANLDLSEESFVGLGNISTAGRPFVGCIDGTGATVSMPNRSEVFDFTYMGFINVSKGCVINDLNIAYNGSTSGYYYLHNVADAVTVNGGASYFGGVIGNIIGGESIIDTVKVEFAEEFKLVVESNEKDYTGGYVGLIQAGGVIFRNCSDSTCNFGIVGSVSLTSTTGTNITSSIVDPDSEYYYQNPIIGRVLDGFAFTEGCKLDNTDKNYTINTLSTTGDDKPLVSMSRKTVSISNAAGLLVFSAALNSGALIGTSTAYNGARSWNKLDATAPYTYTTSSYLAQTYITDFAAINNTVGMTISINEDCDMSGFGNGFRGLGGRYSTPANNNAAITAGSNNTLNTLANVTINGGGKKITVAMNIRQFYQDSTAYKATSVGLINYLNVTATNATTIRNLTISGKIQFLTKGFINLQDNSPTYMYGYAGGLIGATTVNDHFIAISNIVLNDLEIKADNFAGGMVGFFRCKATLTDCIFTGADAAHGLRIEARNAIGGLVGTHFNNSSSHTASGSDCLTITYTADMESKYLTVSLLTTPGSTIPANFISPTNINQPLINDVFRLQGYGGLVGWSGRKIKVTTTDNFTLQLSDVNIEINARDDFDGAGGVVGHICGFSTNIIENVTVINSKISSEGNSGVNISYREESTTVGGAAGGILGSIHKTTASGTDCEVEINSCKVDSTVVYGGSYSGGIVGFNGAKYTGGVQRGRLQIKDCSVSNSSIGFITESSLLSAHSGGIIGRVSLLGLESSAAFQYNATQDPRITLTISGNSVAGSEIKGTYSGTLTGYLSCSVVINETENGGTVIDAVSTEGDYIGALAYIDTTGTALLQNITGKSCVYTLTGTGGYGGGLFGVINNATVEGLGINLYNSTIPTSQSFGTTIGSVSDTVAKVCIIGLSNSFKKTDGVTYKDIAYKAEQNLNCALVYADYKAGETTTGADILTNPAFNWSSTSYWYGDGISPGVPAEIFNSGYNAGFTDINDIIKSLNADGYWTSAPALPVLELKGDSDTLTQNYLNLLTLGGWEAFIKLGDFAGTGLTVSSQQYRISGQNNTIEVTTTGAASLIYDSTTEEFTSTSTFDLRGNDYMTFTVLTTVYQNSLGTITNHLIVYYPKPLTYETSAVGIENENYVITELIKNTINVPDGEGATLLLEYKYDNEHGIIDAMDWNLPKYVSFVSGTGGSTNMPAGTRFVLIDMNQTATDSEGNSKLLYKTYYYTLEADANRSQVNLVSFKDSSGNDFAPVNLNSLTEDDNKMRIERYLLVILMPNQGVTGEDRIVINNQARLDSGSALTDHNTEVLIAQTENNTDKIAAAQLDIWPTAEYTKADVSSSNSTISQNVPLDVTSSVEITYPKDYLEAGTTFDTVIRYTFNGFMLPVGTKITIGGTATTLTAATTYFDATHTITQDDITRGTGQSGKVIISQQVSFDFTDADISSYYGQENMSVVSDLYISVNNGGRHKENLGSVTLECPAETAPPFNIAVDATSQMKLGINLHPSAQQNDSTNNGEIDFHLFIDLTKITTQSDLDAVLNGKISELLVAFDRKNREENGTSYVSAAATDENDTNDTVVEMSITLEGTLLHATTKTFGDYYDRETKLISIPLSMTVNIPETMGTEDYSNYRVTLSIDGAKLSQLSGSTDFFIFTVTYIDPIYKG